MKTPPRGPDDPSKALRRDASGSLAGRTSGGVLHGRYDGRVDSSLLLNPDMLQIDSRPGHDELESLLDGHIPSSVIPVRELAEALLADESKHPRWPQGTVSPEGKHIGGEFMRVGERFNAGGHEWEISHIVNGHVIAMEASGQIGHAETRVFDTQQGAEGPYVPGAAPSAAKKLYSEGQHGTSGSHGNTPIMDADVHSETHDPSIPLPEGSKLTPEEWQTFGRVDQLVYTHVMEKFGAWHPMQLSTGNAPLASKFEQLKAKYDSAIQSVVTKAIGNQYGSSSGETLNLVACFNGVNTSDPQSVAKAMEQYAKARELQGELRELMAWDLYNRARAPDMTIGHYGSSSKSFYDPITEAVSPLLSATSSSWQLAHTGGGQTYNNSNFGSNLLMYSIPVRSAAMGTEWISSMGHGFASEQEITHADALKLDPEKSSYLTYQKLGASHSPLRKWIGSVTGKVVASGEAAKMVKAWLMGKGDLPLPPEPADLKYLPEKGEGQKPSPPAFKLPPSSVVAEAAKLAKDAKYVGGEDADTALKPVSELDIKPGDIIEGNTVGKRYLVIADPSSPVGWRYMKLDGSGVTFTPSGPSSKRRKLDAHVDIPEPEKPPTPPFALGQQVSIADLQAGDKFTAPSGVEHTITGYSGDNFVTKTASGEQAFMSVNDTDKLSFVSGPSGPLQEGPPPFDPSLWAPSGDPQKLGQIPTGSTVAIEGDYFEVTAHVGDATSLKSLQSGKLAKANSGFKTPVLEQVTPHEYQAGDLAFFGPSLVRLTHVGPEGDETVDAVKPNGESFSTAKSGLQPYVPTWAQSSPAKGDTFSKDGQKYTVTAVLKNGIRAKPSGGKVELFEGDEVPANLFRPDAHALGEKLKLKDIPAGTLFSGSPAAKRPYLLLGFDGNQAHAVNLDTGEKVSLSRNKAYRLLPDAAQVEASKPQAPTDASAVTDHAALEPGDHVTVSQLEPGDLFHMEGKPAVTYMFGGKVTVGGVEKFQLQDLKGFDLAALPWEPNHGVVYQGIVPKPDMPLTPSPELGAHSLSPLMKANDSGLALKDLPMGAVYAFKDSPGAFQHSKVAEHPPGGGVLVQQYEDTTPNPANAGFVPAYIWLPPEQKPAGAWQAMPKQPNGLPPKLKDLVTSGQLEPGDHFKTSGGAHYVLDGQAPSGKIEVHKAEDGEPTSFLGGLKVAQIMKKAPSEAAAGEWVDQPPGTKLKDVVADLSPGDSVMTSGHTWVFKGKNAGGHIGLEDENGNLTHFAGGLTVIKVKKAAAAAGEPDLSTSPDLGVDTAGLVKPVALESLPDAVKDGGFQPYTSNAGPNNAYKHDKLKMLAEGTVFLDKTGKPWVVKQSGATPVISDGWQNFTVDGNLRVKQAKHSKKPVVFSDNAPGLNEPQHEPDVPDFEPDVPDPMAGQWITPSEAAGHFKAPSGNFTASSLGLQPGDQFYTITGNGPYTLVELHGASTTSQDVALDGDGAPQTWGSVLVGKYKKASPAPRAGKVVGEPVNYADLAVGDKFENSGGAQFLVTDIQGNVLHFQKIGGLIGAGVAAGTFNLSEPQSDAVSYKYLGKDEPQTGFVGGGDVDLPHLPFKADGLGVQDAADQEPHTVALLPGTDQVVYKSAGSKEIGGPKWFAMGALAPMEDQPQSVVPLQIKKPDLSTMTTADVKLGEVQPGEAFAFKGQNWLMLGRSDEGAHVLNYQTGQVYHVTPLALQKADAIKYVRKPSEVKPDTFAAASVGDVFVGKDKESGEAVFFKKTGPNSAKRLSLKGNGAAPAFETVVEPNAPAVVLKTQPVSQMSPGMVFNSPVTHAKIQKLGDEPNGDVKLKMLDPGKLGGTVAVGHVWTAKPDTGEPGIVHGVEPIADAPTEPGPEPEEPEWINVEQTPIAKMGLKVGDKALDYDGDEHLVTAVDPGNGTVTTKWGPQGEHTDYGPSQWAGDELGVKAFKPGPEHETPEPEPEPEKSSVLPDYSHVTLSGGSSAGGTTGAQIMSGPGGEKWLRKTYGGDQDRVATELLANRVYNALGVKAADAGVQHLPDGKVALAYPLVDGKPGHFSGIFKDQLSDEERARQIALGKDYMADALMANFDFVGADDDNVLWNGNEPTRVDQGGTFFYRAQGQPKPFTGDPSEVFSMLAKGQAKRGVIVSEQSMREQAKHIAEVMTPEKIDALVDAAPFKDQAMREKIRSALKARVAWMKEFGNGIHGVPLEVKPLLAPDEAPTPKPQAAKPLSSLAGKIAKADTPENALAGANHKDWQAASDAAAATMNSLGVSAADQEKVHHAAATLIGERINAGMTVNASVWGLYYRNALQHVAPEVANENSEKGGAATKAAELYYAVQQAINDSHHAASQVPVKIEAPGKESTDYMNANVLSPPVKVEAPGTPSAPAVSMMALKPYGSKWGSGAKYIHDHIKDLAKGAIFRDAKGDKFVVLDQNDDAGLTTVHDHQTNQIVQVPHTFTDKNGKVKPTRVRVI